MKDKAMNISRVPPQNIDAEKALIGSILRNSKYLPFIIRVLDPDDFYREAHVLIFKSIVKLKNIKTEIDVITVADQLEKNHDLDKSGGTEYLLSLAVNAPPSVSWEYHCNIIKEKSQRRKIIELGLLSSEQAYSPMTQIDEILTMTKSTLTDIDRDKNIEDTNNEKLGMDTYNGIFEKKDPGIYTGVQGIGKRLYLEDGYIHCVAAESGVGKSAFCLQLSDYVSKTYKKKVPYYSLESTNQRLVRRWLCRNTEIPLSCINNNDFRHDGEIEKIQIACDDFGKSRLMLFDDSKFTYIERLLSHLESYCLNNEVSMACIDFLQALDSIKSFSSDRSKFNYIVNRIKSTAKDLNIPIVYACQLRKDINGRPKLDDLIESNYIRTHTDNILFLYAPDSDPVIYPVECFLAKGKEQERFSRWLEFNGNYQVFYEGEKPLDLIRYKKNKKVDL